MATPKDLSTPQCPAEHRAWLLIYQNRIGWGKPLEEGFRKQFPDYQYDRILFHAAHAKGADEEVRSRLMDLAKQCSWYEDPPKKGELYYKRFKRLERHEEARERRKTKPGYPEAYFG